MISDILNSISSWFQRIKETLADSELKKDNLKEPKTPKPPKKEYEMFDEIMIRDIFLSISLDMWILIILFILAYFTSKFVFDGILI